MSIRDYSRRLLCNIKWCGLRCNPSCLYSSTDNTFHAYQVPSFCLLPSGYLIVCFVHVSVCASEQLEMHRPEDKNKITDVRALTCTTFHFIFNFYRFFFDGNYACFHMGLVRLISRLIHEKARQMGACN